MCKVKPSGFCEIPHKKQKIIVRFQLVFLKTVALRESLSW